MMQSLRVCVSEPFQNIVKGSSPYGSWEGILQVATLHAAQYTHVTVIMLSYRLKYLGWSYVLLHHHD